MQAVTKTERINGENEKQGEETLRVREHRLELEKSKEKKQRDDNYEAVAKIEEKRENIHFIEMERIK